MTLDALKGISWTTTRQCRVCGQALRDPVINLPALPITEVYVEAPPGEKVGLVDQGLHVCKRCGHAQLSNVLDPNVLYGSAYSFRTSRSMSVKGNEAFAAFIDNMTGRKKWQTIMEVGCNDLYLLNVLKGRAERLVGIDPMLKGRERELTTGKIEAIGDFFENVEPSRYKGSGSTLILSSHVVEHLQDPARLLKTLVENADDQTRFVFQFPGFETVVQDRRFDQVYHHHLHYFSLRSFAWLLDECACELLDHAVNHHYWGSVMVAFKRRTRSGRNPLAPRITIGKVRQRYRQFRAVMQSTNEYLKTLAKERVLGYGAGLQVPVLSYHLQNDLSLLECILDDNPDKEGLFYPNLSVPIRHPSKVGTLEDAIVFVTGANFARAIARRAIELRPRRIVFPTNIM